MLNLCENRITQIKGLENLHNLKSLDLQNNKIIELNNLDSLVKLNELNIKGNNLPKNEQNLVQKSINSIQEYCKKKKENS